MIDSSAQEIIALSWMFYKNSDCYIRVFSLFLASRTCPAVWNRHAFSHSVYIMTFLVHQTHFIFHSVGKDSCSLYLFIFYLCLKINCSFTTISAVFYLVHSKILEGVLQHPLNLPRVWINNCLRKNLCYQSSHYRNYWQYPLRMEAISCISIPFAESNESNDEWDKKESTGKFMKNALCTVVWLKAPLSLKGHRIAIS